MRPRHLVLIGLSFSGKSTVGAVVAAKLDLPFVDTDVEVERRSGMSVTELFSQQGEAAFRRLEQEVVRVVVAGTPSIIATGGGAPLQAASRRALWDNNLVVFLDTSPEAVVARLRAAPGAEARPLLVTDNPLRRVREMQAQRHAIYRQAHLVVRTDGRTPEAVAACVVTAWYGAIEAP